MDSQFHTRVVFSNRGEFYRKNNGRSRFVRGVKLNQNTIQSQAKWMIFSKLLKRIQILLNCTLDLDKNYEYFH